MKTLLVILIVAAVASGTAVAQEPSLTVAAIAQSSQQPVPTLVRSEGTLVEHRGEKLLLRFSVYANEASHAPLWSEQQLIQFGPKGEYSVLLGAGSAIGLPQALFAAGEPRWLAIQVGEREESRTLLTSVPYAMKSANADTLGGQPATSFVTREELTAKLHGAAAALTTQAVQVAQPMATQPMVGPTGGGATGSLALWTSATALGNSALTQTGAGISAKVGVATAVPAATLDVNGTSNFRNRLTLSGIPATATAGVNSPNLQLAASSFSSISAAAIAQNFVWQAQTSGNNTATPSARLALLFGAGAANPAATGLSIAPNGVITFAAGQSFPSSSTSFPKGATFGAESTITGSSTDWMLVATNTSASSKGTILGQASTTGIGVAGASPGGIGVKGISDTGYGVYGIANTTGTAIYGAAYGTGAAGRFWSQNASGPAVVVNNVAGGAALSSTATNGYGGYFANSSTYQATVYAANAGNGNAGSFNNTSASRVSLAGVNASTDPNAIATYGSVSNGKAVYGTSANGFGLYGTSSNQTGVHGDGGKVGVEGIVGGGAPTLTYFVAGSTEMGLYGTVGTAQAGLFPVGVVGTAGDASAGYFENNSTSSFAVEITDDAGGPGHNIFRTLVASTPDGVCGFGSAGTLTCTGQVKSLVNTAGDRHVETYSVQSAENWLEDYGSGELVNGIATVALDPVFAGTVNTAAQYHVFLTPVGDCKGLYVDRKTAGSFEVHELGGGTSHIAFDYKIVAKRLGHESERLVDVTEEFHHALDSRLSQRMKKSQSTPASEQNPTEPIRNAQSEEK